ncbi:hypothetical protein TWF730_002593 [Orbilia blumenaviensis]|uniref:Nucleoside phosphorylase domain-containing protein n=1 Tax=Orbilia blumenaviensis TaxID=1796055 RepID=A0AAV9UET3_9PEZI
MLIPGSKTKARVPPDLSTSGLEGQPPQIGQAPPSFLPAKSLSYDDYTVGWICALSEELTAAKAMLEDKHPSLPNLLPKDSNTYTLGSIHGHNIVIACMPEGMLGNNHAATTAIQMVNTFRSVKVGLLVGIGGAVSPKVGLGDIVVSKPVGQHPGVIQWDLGKAGSFGKFTRIGILNKPPKLLLTAMGDLISEHNLHGPGTNIQKHLDSLKRLHPHLGPKYWQPGRPLRHQSKRKLPLFIALAVALGLLAYSLCHSLSVPQDIMVTTLKGCIIALMVATSLTYRFGGSAPAPVDREVEQEESRRVNIHYGLIASGNQVIKSGSFRDSLNDRLGGTVLCVEMEAAGLMEDFPCIVIRGISDYADSSKNDDWREYAATIAAAYAKDFLGCLPVSAVVKELPTRDCLRQVHDNVVEVKSLLEKDEQRKILKWLTSVEYNRQHHDITQKRRSGTGQWLLDSDQYHEWFQNRKRILFCKGIPGGGKTFITSIVIDHLLQLDSYSAIGVAYIYFDYKRNYEQTIYNLLASLLKQLAHRRRPFPEHVKRMYDRHESNKTWPSTNDIIEALRCVATEYSRVFVVVDALDECQVSDYCRNNFLSAIFELYTECEINIFASSRDIEEITERFKLQGSMVLEIRAHAEDVRSYLNHQINQSQNEMLQKDHETIVARIVEAVDGMFLLARLHFESIKNKTTTKKLREALKTLATGESAYDQAYGEAMERINNQNSDLKLLAHQVLSWIVCAERPLSKLELQHALAVELEVNQCKLDNDNFPGVNTMISVCAGLVTIDDESNIIRLIHHTTQEYFNRAWKGKSFNIHNNIAKVCATYLSFEIFDTGPVDPTEGVLYRYAAQNWGHHARKSSVETTEPIISGLLKNPKRVSVSSKALGVAQDEDFNNFGPTNMTGMHLAAYFGLREYVDQLLRKGASHLTKDTHGKTPLSYAAQWGHAAVVELLLTNGADWEFKNSYYGQTPLVQAAARGHAAVVVLLLNKGASLETKYTFDGQTLLSIAAENGRTNVVELLLREGANRDAENMHNKTALFFAAEKGHATVVELLLREGANKEAKDKTGQTPLSWAAKKGHTAVTELLLTEGADQEAKDKSGQTALLWASENGHVAVVRLLLLNGADREVKDNEYSQTPLSRAAEWGHTATAQLLLREGADRETKDKYGRTPLLWATARGHIASVKLFLHEGSDREAKDNNGRTPLSLSAEEGHTEIVELLLREGADREAKGEDGRTPLSWAAEWEHIPIMELLLREGADKEAKDNDGRTPLFWATIQGHVEVVELLLREGADREVIDKEGRTLLSWAVKENHAAVVELLQGYPIMIVDTP